MMAWKVRAFRKTYTSCTTVLVYHQQNSWLYRLDRQLLVLNRCSLAIWSFRSSSRDLHNKNSSMSTVNCEVLARCRKLSTLLCVKDDAECLQRCRRAKKGKILRKRLYVTLPGYVSERSTRRTKAKQPRDSSNSLRSQFLFWGPIYKISYDLS